MSQRENFILILPNWLSCEDDFGSISFILLVRFVHLISFWYEIISYFLSAAKLSIFLYYNLNFPLHIYSMKYAESVPRFKLLSSSFSCFTKIDLRPPVWRLFGTFGLTWDDFVCRRWSKALRHFLLRQRFGWQRHTYTKKLNDERS